MSKMIFGKLNHGNVKEKEWFTRGWLSASYIESIFVRIVSRNHPHNQNGASYACIIYRGCIVELVYSNHPRCGLYKDVAFIKR